MPRVKRLPYHKVGKSKIIQVQNVNRYTAIPFVNRLFGYVIPPKSRRKTRLKGK